jgi:hypothetical protein
VPQLPQVIIRVALGVQGPWPMQVPADHWQLALQVSVSLPQLPHPTVRVLLGAHGPSLAQGPNAPQVPSEPQVRPREPQLPHAIVCTAPGEQPLQP